MRQIRILLFSWSTVLASSLLAIAQEDASNSYRVHPEPRLINVSMDFIRELNEEGRRLGPESPVRVLTDIETFFLIQAVVAKERNIRAAPKLTCSNGERMELSGIMAEAEIECGCVVTPQIADDGKSCVWLVEPSEDAMTLPHAIRERVEQGQGLLIFLQADDAEENAYYILLTTRFTEYR